MKDIHRGIKNPWDTIFHYSLNSIITKNEAYIASLRFFLPCRFTKITLYLRAKPWRQKKMRLTCKNWEGRGTNGEQDIIPGKPYSPAWGGQQRPEEAPWGRGCGRPPSPRGRSGKAQRAPHLTSGPIKLISYCWLRKKSKKKLIMEG